MKKLIFLFIMSCALLIGCKNGPSQDLSTENQEFEYQYTISDMKKNYLNDCLPNFLSFAGDYYYFLKPGEMDNQNDLWRYDINNDKAEQVYSLEEDENILLITSDGVNVAFLSKCWSDDGNSKSFITRNSEDGFERCDISDAINQNALYIYDDMVMDSNGDVWFYADGNDVFCINKDGVFSKFTQEGRVKGLILDDSKGVSVLTHKDNELRLTEIITGKSKSVELEGYLDFDVYGVSHGFLDDELIIWTIDKGFFVNFDKGIINPFITAGDLQITNLSACSFDVWDGNIYLYEDSYSGEQIKISRGRLTKKTGEEKTKEQLVLGVFGSDNYLIDSVREFNLSHSEYEITVKNYANWSSDDGGISEFTKDLIDGNVPDIMLINEKMHPYQLVDKGIFLDMREFLKEDEGFSEEDFLANILDACTYHDCLYALPVQFSIHGCIARSGFVGGAEELSLDEIERIMNENQELNMASFNSSYLLLKGMLLGGEREFVTDAGLNYQKDDFAKLILFAEKYGQVKLSESMTIFDYFHDGKLLFIYDKDISPYFIRGELPGYSKIVDGTVTITGIPGITRDNVYVDIISEYAISAFCEHKDAAWEFVRQFYEKDYQNMIVDSGDHFSILKDITFSFIESASCDQSYKEQLKEMLSQKILIYDSDSEISDIICEEALMYFNGERTMEEAVDILYSRLSIYAEERK